MIFIIISALNSTASPSDSSEDENDILYHKDAVFDALELNFVNVSTESSDRLQNASSELMVDSGKTTQGPSLEQKLTEAYEGPRSTQPISTARPCALDCGQGGSCVIGGPDELPTCLCPLGRGGERCEKGIVYSVFVFLDNAKIWQQDD